FHLRTDHPADVLDPRCRVITGVERGLKTRDGSVGQLDADEDRTLDEALRCDAEFDLGKALEEGQCGACLDRQRVAGEFDVEHLDIDLDAPWLHRVVAWFGWGAGLLRL